MMADVADVRSVLFLYCPEDVLEKRLLSRGKSSGRTDDNAETAKRRFQTYVETTLPVSPFLTCDGADYLGPDDTFARSLAVLGFI